MHRLGLYRVLWLIGGLSRYCRVRFDYVSLCAVRRMLMGWGAHLRVEQQAKANVQANSKQKRVCTRPALISFG